MFWVSGFETGKNINLLKIQPDGDQPAGEQLAIIYLSTEGATT
jgi:hypothetical protein